MKTSLSNSSMPAYFVDSPIHVADAFSRTCVCAFPKSTELTCGFYFKSAE